MVGILMAGCNLWIDGSILKRGGGGGKIGYDAPDLC